MSSISLEIEMFIDRTVRKDRQLWRYIKVYRNSGKESKSSQIASEDQYAITVLVDPKDISFTHKTSDEISNATRIAARRDFMLDHHELFGLGFVQVLRDYVGYKNVRLNL